MSINLGVFDFFSSLMSGLLYPYTINEFLRNTGQKIVDIEIWFRSGPSPSQIAFIPSIIGASIVGSIMDPVAQRLFQIFYHLRSPKKVYAGTLGDMKNTIRIWIKGWFPKTGIFYYVLFDVLISKWHISWTKLMLMGLCLLTLRLDYLHWYLSDWESTFQPMLGYFWLIQQVY